MDARTPNSNDRCSDRLAARSLRPRRAGAAGRRRARRLSGRRLSGAARGRHRAELGLRRLDRRASIRRSSPAIRRSAGSNGCGHSGSASPPARSGTTRRTATSIARRATSRARCMTTTLGQPGFFKPHDANPWLSPAGARTATSYYDTAPLRETLLELVDFDLINDTQDALRGRRRQRADRQFPLFRQHQGRDRARARDGERRAAAGAADGEDRHRPFLGRRHRLQHAAAASARPGGQRSTRWCSRSTCSAPAACCRATSRTCWRGTRTSCIPRAPATTPTSTSA